MTNKRKNTVGLPRLSSGHVCSRRAGMTLAEMTVVISIAALMVGLTIPAANMLLNSFESQSGAKSTISAALASARAIAAKEQRYAGIRFQKRYDSANPIEASQYIIFIIQDPNMQGTWGFGFHAVDGIQPIKLPDSIGVMDMLVLSSRNQQNPVNSLQTKITTDADIDSDQELIDTTTFSIIFSPVGKLVIHGVRVRNRDSAPHAPDYLDNSQDDVFNTLTRIIAPANPAGMLLQDEYFGISGNPNLGLGPEPSRNNFYIYDTKTLKQTNPNRRWTDYLNRLKAIYINPYTGTIVNEK